MPQRAGSKRMSGTLAYDEFSSKFLRLSGTYVQTQSLNIMELWEPLTQQESSRSSLKVSICISSTYTKRKARNFLGIFPAKIYEIAVKYLTQSRLKMWINKYGARVVKKNPMGMFNNEKIRVETVQRHPPKKSNLLKFCSPLKSSSIYRFIFYL